MSLKVVMAVFPQNDIFFRHPVFFTTVSENWRKYSFKSLFISDLLWKLHLMFPQGWTWGLWPGCKQHQLQGWESQVCRLHSACWTGWGCFCVQTTTETLCHHKYHWDIWHCLLDLHIAIFSSGNNGSIYHHQECLYHCICLYYSNNNIISTIKSGCLKHTQASVFKKKIFCFLFLSKNSNS